MGFRLAQVGLVLKSVEMTFKVPVSGVSRAAVVALLVASMAGQFGCAPKSKPSEKASAGGSPSTPVPAPAAAPASPRVDPSKAKGRWVRSDGGYVLAIGAIDADGRAEAAYFNPNPIKVAWGRVLQEGPYLRVSVELRDENYPGCIYKLGYIPETDRLVGTYFQAQLQQTYEVEFGREQVR